MADLILITHSHYDHLSREDIERVRGLNTKIIIPASCRQSFGEDAITLEPGESVSVLGGTIDGIAAYNTESRFHPVNNRWLGYVIHLPDVTIYHSGDTDFIPEMNDINVDVALLPVSGTFTMNAEQAARAAVAVDASVAVPIHWGDIIGSRDDAEHFVQLLSSTGIKSVIMDQER
jgi:L-ascorbate metabolism protein UlaG (beta-lactamase superfamily)